MDYLKLLSLVIPAFGAFARKYTQNGRKRDAQRHAGECFQEIAGIGRVLYSLGREWRLDLDTSILDDLFKALVKRIVKPKGSRSKFRALARLKAARQDSTEGVYYAALKGLADKIDAEHLGGYYECSLLGEQSPQRDERYLVLLKDSIRMFSEEELENAAKRMKFLKCLNKAHMHLLDVYNSEERFTRLIDSDEMHDYRESTLSQHPSHGMRQLAESVHRALKQHWSCHCSHGMKPSIRAREARLSLIRHRKLVLKIKESQNQELSPASFEVLLPICTPEAPWKVSNVEVQTHRSPTPHTNPGELVNHDICRHLCKNYGIYRTDFVLHGDHFWCLPPRWRANDKDYRRMQALDHFLGDEIGASYLSTCHPKEQIILCYILATSMLYLYPSSWAQPSLSSHMVHFIHQPSPSLFPIITFPYISIDLQSQDTVANPSQEPIHSHPAILALGIILLEIISGKKFEKSEDPLLNRRRAIQELTDLEQQKRNYEEKRISARLCEVIRACLQPELPSTFPTNDIRGEGPIRYYILTCIVGPLAFELEKLFGLNLEDLHSTLLPENGADLPAKPDGLQRSSLLSNSFDETIVETNEFVGEKKLYVASCSRPLPSLRPDENVCLFRNRNEPVDERRATAATKCFELYDTTTARIKELRDLEPAKAHRVKIAILDSGIQLSPEAMDLHNFEPEMQYKSWVDADDVGWKDEMGHGTHLSVLLRRIAPNAIICNGRVFTGQPTEDSVEIIAKAIRYAVDEWKVDIIVIAFGFPDEHDCIIEEIGYAAFKNVLIFAAASNDGKNRPDRIAWPARDSRVFCVHSGDGTGTPSTFTPHAVEDKTIMVLGECVQSAWTSHLNGTSDSRLMSGTSCAAPIAAGIAALVLDYARSFLTTVEAEKFRRKDPMRRFFDRMQVSGRHYDYWWICPWLIFAEDDANWIKGEIRRAIKGYA